MKKIPLINQLITLIFLLVFSTTCLAGYEIEFFNTYDQKKIYQLEWVDHPYGCYTHYGVLNCSFYPAIGEVPPHEIRSVKRKYTKQTLCIKWRDLGHVIEPADHPNNCFDVSDNINIIISTPDSLDILYKGTAE